MSLLPPRADRARSTAPPSAVRHLARLLCGEGDFARLAGVVLRDEGHGYDSFGASVDWVRLAHGLARWPHEHWFRVESHGVEHVPAQGPAVLAANHSGTLPFDAIMVWEDVLRHTQPPRVARGVLDHFVPMLPFVGTLFNRAGSVGGSRNNLEQLLEEGQLVLVFPEGTRGIGKPFRERYHLQGWNVGHVEVALAARAPVVPVAVIGAEEQMPQVARLPVRAFGLPYLPLPAVPLPLPVRYHIYYGEPLLLHERHDPRSSDDPRVLEALALEVKRAVEALIARGLAERAGVFR